MGLSSFIIFFWSLSLLFGNFLVLAEDFQSFQLDQNSPEESLLNKKSESQLSSYDLPSSKELQIEVRARKKKVQGTSSVSRTEINRQEVEKLPLGNEISLSRLLTSTMPGAVPGAFGQMFFRGSHGNIMYQIDGIQMPDSPSNTFGQAFSPRNLEQLEVITGGMPAEYGWRLGAVVNMTTRSGTLEPEGEAEINYGSYNTTSPHLLYSSSLFSGDLKYFLSLNYKQTDRGIDTPQPDSYSNQKQGGKDAIHDFSQSNSEFLKLDWQFNNQNKLYLNIFHTYTQLQIPNYPSSFLSSDPYFNTPYTDQFGNSSAHSANGHTHHDPVYYWVPSHTGSVQFERNAYIQGIWKHTFSEQSFLQIAPYYKYSWIKFQNDLNNELSSAYNSIQNDEAASLFQDRTIHNVGIKTDYTYRIHPDHLLKVGFQGQFSTSLGSTTINTPTSQSTDSYPSSGYYEGIYIQDDFKFSSQWMLNVGLRFDATQFSFHDAHSEDFMLQPRIGLNFFPSDQIKLHAFYGKLFNPAPLENLRSSFNAASGNPNALNTYDIKAQKDDFYEIGIDYLIIPQQIFTFNFFVRDSLNVIDESQLLRTAIAQPFNLAQGYAFGPEISLKGKITENISQYINYSYVMGKGKGLSGGIWASHTHGGDQSGYQVYDHLQFHTANTGLTLSKYDFWWTTQAMYGSGLRTGPSNSIDLPDHFTFDTTLGYEFKKKGSEDSWYSGMQIAGDVLNILDNRYPITIANDFNGSRYSAGRQYFLRLTKFF